MTAPVTHGSWVTWVMGQELDGSLGSWVTLSDPFPALMDRAMALCLSVRQCLRLSQIVLSKKPKRVVTQQRAHDDSLGLLVFLTRVEIISRVLSFSILQTDFGILGDFRN